MKKNSIIYLTFIGLIGLLSGCEKDGTKVVISDNPIAPTIVTIPNLTLSRPNGTDTLVFVGTPVDPGFQASANYYLEACAKGTNFAKVISIVSGIQDAAMKITVSDLNGIMLKSFPPDQVSAVDFRIRSVLVSSAGAGVTPLQYISATKSADVTPYGLPRLDLIGSGIDQKIESALGDGKYKGFVKLDVTKAFTLKDPDAGTVYGDNAGALKVDGAPIPIPSSGSGWYKMTVDTKGLKYTLTPYMIGIIGSATPNSWNTPDTKMDYDIKSATWKITLDLKPSMDGGVMKCEYKFRLNDGWAWNLGGTPASLTVDGANLVATEGNYTIVLTITNPNAVKPEVGGFCTVTKN